MLDEELRTLKTMSVRDIVRQILSLGGVVTSALIMWQVMMLVLWTSTPIVVVLSGSMEPGYYRNDLLLLSSPDRALEVGDICVFSLAGRDIPIVHRIHRVHENATGEVAFLTKGDNNYHNDLSLYNPGQFWLAESNLMGRSTAYLPYVGMLTILIQENLWIKVSVLGLLGFFVLVSKEE